MRIIAGLFAASLACAPALAQTGTPTFQGGRAATATVTTRLTVESIDPVIRAVVLRREDGSFTTYRAGPEVRNFAQIRVGDIVEAEVSESIAVGLFRGGQVPPANSGTAVVRARPGERPGIASAKVVQVPAVVQSVDTSTRTVTLRWSDGSTAPVKVGPDINLENVRQGDEVVVQITETAVVAVRPPR